MTWACLDFGGGCYMASSRHFRSSGLSLIQQFGPTRRQIAGSGTTSVSCWVSGRPWVAARRAIDGLSLQRTHGNLGALIRVIISLTATQIANPVRRCMFSGMNEQSRFEVLLSKRRRQQLAELADELDLSSADLVRLSTQRAQGGERAA